MLFNQKNNWTWKVSTPYKRADLALLKTLEKSSQELRENGIKITRTKLQKWIQEGHITVNDKLIQANTKLKKGDTLKIHFPPAIPTKLVPEDQPIDLLYEDDFLLVLNKPPGLTVHPAQSQPQGTLVHALLHHIKNLSGIGGVLRPGIVHRIDKNTSGALVIAKTDIAHTELSLCFAKHSIERTYWALCYGAPLGEKTVSHKIESLIGRNPTDRKKMAITQKTGKHAVSYFKKKETYGSPLSFASWLEIKLETGRTHQVRVHLTSIGHSLLGDPVYGVPHKNQSKWISIPEEIRTSINTLPGQALHAHTLGFIHPITQKKLHFEANPPASFEELHKKLKKYKI